MSKVSDSVFVSSQTVEWATDQAFFDQLDREFHFTVDVAANAANAKCERFYSVDDDGLLQDWTSETVWCNPPYGRRIGDWVYKAATSDATTVLLVPSRTDVAWFHDYVVGRAEVRFVRGRLRFGGAKDPAPFPNMLVIFRNGVGQEIAMSEAQKEAERRYPSSPARSFTEGQTVQARRDAFVAGAEWQAEHVRARQQPVEITDDMVERAAKVISNAPFPSARSLSKARAALKAALGGDDD